MTNRIKYFDKIVKMTQKELKDYMADKLSEAKYPVVVNTKSYIYAEGTIPIALVAHLDTVFEDKTRENMLVLFDEEYGVYWSFDGLGADDRAGCAMILKILKETSLRPHIILTTDEEIFEGGALELSKLPCPFDELKYMIELDRAGGNDMVFYDCDNPDFAKYVGDFGFEEARGSFTDISLLAPAWGVAGVNLSIGYINEHSRMETLTVPVWENTCHKVVNMIQYHYTAQEFKYIPKEYIIAPPLPDIPEGQCIWCGHQYPEQYLMDVYDEVTNQRYDMCSWCYSELGRWGDIEYDKINNRDIINYQELIKDEELFEEDKTNGKR